MEIEEYRKQFIDELRFNAEHEGTEPETQFIEKTLNDLEEIGELNDPIPMSVEMRGARNRILAFDAYAYDEADGALVLIASDFTNQRDITPTLTNTRIEELYGRMLNFVEESVQGNISKYCDYSDPAILIANEFRKKIGKGMLSTEILRFKFFIIRVLAAVASFRCSHIQEDHLCSAIFFAFLPHTIYILYTVFDFPAFFIVK